MKLKLKDRTAAIKLTHTPRDDDTSTNTELVEANHPRAVSFKTFKFKIKFDLLNFAPFSIAKHHMHRCSLSCVFFDTLLQRNEFVKIVSSFFIRVALYSIFNRIYRKIVLGRTKERALVHAKEGKMRR